MTKSFPKILAGVLAFSTVGCDYSGDWVYLKTTDVPGIVDIGMVEIATVEAITDLDDAIHYGQVGVTGDTRRGGATFEFEGTGSSVCVWVDPELAFWSNSVSVISPTEEWMWPDNLADDGDLDLAAGFSVYYSGTPGQEFGDFEIRYEDTLGNIIPVDFDECVQSGQGVSTGAHAGRGAPEYCTLSATQPGVSYTVAMELWSTPSDDSVLSFGYALVEGSCNDLRAIAGSRDECVITGEALDPETGETVEGSVNFEQAFCNAIGGGGGLTDYCMAEWETKDCDVDTCFCGDPSDSPTDFLATQ